MIAVDVNLLVYAYAPSLDRHATARDWLEARLSGPQRVGLPWPSLIGFLRLVTDPRIFEQPRSFAEAWRCVREWLELESVWVPLPGSRHAIILEALLPHCGRSAQIPDAHLAALAIEHGLTLCSTDGDFARFAAAGLRWENPLA